MLDSETYEKYFKALLAGDSETCFSIIEVMFGKKVTVPDIFEHVFRRSLYQVGELWSKNIITVADEHIATAVTEKLLAQLQTIAEPSKRLNKKVLISCITSDHHQIGAKMISVLFEQSGWDSYFLGANMPLKDLINVIDRINPDVICLSITLQENLRSLEFALREIQQGNSERPILIGGRALSDLSQFGPSVLNLENVHVIESTYQLEQTITSL